MVRRFSQILKSSFFAVSVMAGRSFSNARCTVNLVQHVSRQSGLAFLGCRCGVLRWHMAGGVLECDFLGIA
jgi:hypothetical protein